MISYVRLGSHLFKACLVCLSLATIESCNLIDNDKDGLSLPPYSETGSNTFGCLVNGEVIVARGGGFSSIRNLVFTSDIIRDTPTFSLGGSDLVLHHHIVIRARGVLPDHDTVLPIRKERFGIAGATYQYDDSEGQNSSNPYESSDSTVGELMIKYYNREKRITSGTFWFDAIEPGTGKRVEVRDGRFDIGQ